MSDKATETATTPAPEVAESGPTLERIAKLESLDESYIGKFVKLYGWVYSTRSQGAGTLVFVDLGDGTTVTPVRCIAQRQAEDATLAENEFAYDSHPDLLSPSGDETNFTQLSFDEMGQTASLSIGCSVLICGAVVAPPEGTTQTLEVKILQLLVIGGVADPTTYPIQKSILKKPLALRSHHHARFRAPLVQQILQIRSQTLFAVHEFFHTEGVPLLDPNIMTSSDCEGAGEVFKVTPQFFSKEAVEADAAAADSKDGGDEKPAQPTTMEVGLTVSSQLPLEAIAMGTGAVYTCQKSFRAEKSDTIKHLAEFLHVEFEQYFITLDDLLDQAERFVKYLIRTVLDRCPAQYQFLNHKTTAPPEFHGHAAYLASLLEKPFVRIKHADAIAEMQQDLRDKVKTLGASGKMVKLKFKEYPQQGEDLGSEHEKYLVQKYGTFVFVTHWPSDIKSFYMKQVGDGTCESFDLLAPLVGELFGGSMREWRLDVLEDIMSKRGMDTKPLQWFIDLRKDGTAPHGGWGMGLDRLVMFLTNAPSVRDVVPYPVYYGFCPY